MKALPKKLLPLTLFGIAVTSLFCVQPAEAFTITLEQMGLNVVATGSGAFNLTGLNLNGSLPVGTGSYISAQTGEIDMGPTGTSTADKYRGFTGPTSFGSGSGVVTFTGSGDFVSMRGLFGYMLVPHGYASGTLLSDSATYNGATFASLGVTPGTYVWTWGTGLPNQNFTLIIEGAGVPDGGSTVALLGCALLGLAALRRKLSC